MIVGAKTFACLWMMTALLIGVEPAFGFAHAGCRGTLVNKRTLISIENPFNPMSDPFILNGFFEMVVTSEPTSWSLGRNNHFANYHWLSTGFENRPPEETFLLLDGYFLYTRPDGSMVELAAELNLETYIVYSDHAPEPVQSGATIRPIEAIQPFVEPIWNDSWFPAIQHHHFFFSMMLNDLQLIDPMLPSSIELVNRDPLLMQGQVNSWNFHPDGDVRREGPAAGTEYALLEPVHLFRDGDSYTDARPLGEVLSSDVTVVGHYLSVPEPPVPWLLGSGLVLIILTRKNPKQGAVFSSCANSITTNQQVNSFLERSPVEQNVHHWPPGTDPVIGLRSVGCCPERCILRQ